MRSSVLPVFAIIVCAFLFPAPTRARDGKRSDYDRLSGLAENSWRENFQFWPVLNKFPQTEYNLGFDVTYSRQHGKIDTWIRLTGSPLRMKKDDNHMKFRFFQFSVERRHFFRNRMYWGLTFGLNYFQPESRIERYYDGLGLDIGAKRLSFTRIALGWQATRVLLFRKWYPLVVKAAYTFSDDFDFPAELPDGGHRISPGGFGLSLGLRYRF